MRFTFRQQNPATKADEEREEHERLASKHPDTGTDTKVQQSFRDETDLNIMAFRFGIDPLNLPPQAADPRYYGDFTDAEDFTSAVQRSKEALDRFDALPSDIRQQFDHNPARFFEWVSNEKNQEKAVELGILKKPEPQREPPPQRVIVIPDASTPGTGGSTTQPVADSGTKPPAPRSA